MGKRMTLTLISLIMCTCLLSACNSFEGSGSKDAASAEQLALRTEDPWDKEIKGISQSTSLQLKDGTYTGEAAGVDGLITVTIEVKDQVINCKQITQEGETQSVGGFEAIRDGKYAEMINASQGEKIDAIAGATLTSAAVPDALNNAIEQAKI